MNSLSNSLIAAFSEQHAERLTGISQSQLRYWDKIGFFSPAFADEERRRPFKRVYSFKDLVALKVLNVLRNQYNVSLPHLRKVSERLGHLDKDKWTGVKLYVLNRKVIWDEPNTKKPQEIVSQQYLVPVVFDAIIDDTAKSVALLNEREPDSVGKISRSRFINHNAPVISGTRIPVTAIKSFSNAGYGVADILREYPDLTEQDVLAAIAYTVEKAAA